MLVYLNGDILEAHAARISPLDRGFIFGDGIYEGLRAVVVNGQRRLVGLDHHQNRLSRGLDAISLKWDASQLGAICNAVLDANDLQHAFVYFQISRGSPMPGAFVRTRVPVPDMRPTVFAFASPVAALEEVIEPTVRRAILVEDTRWRLGHIKSISLLANVLAAIEADEHRVDDAIFVRDGIVTEGTATNLFAVVDGQLLTPALDSAPMLAGITRQLLLDSERDILEVPISVDALRRAREIILVGTNTMIASVTHLDGKLIGDGTPGPQARRLLERLVDAIRSSCR